MAFSLTRSILLSIRAEFRLWSVARSSIDTVFICISRDFAGLHRGVRNRIGAARTPGARVPEGLSFAQAMAWCPLVAPRPGAFRSQCRKGGL